MGRFGFFSAILSLASGALIASAVAAPLAPSSRAGFVGVGPIIFGTTPAQARATGIRFAATQPVKGSTCYYLRPTGVAGISFIVENGTLRRADITNDAIATTDGLRVGDPASKLVRLFGSRLVRAPDKYDPQEQTMTLAPLGDTDSKYRMVFRVKGSVLRSIVVGVRPQVEYVEGCS